MEADVPGGEGHFVDRYREELIQRITNVPPVLDCLLQRRLLTPEVYSMVKDCMTTTQEKMRALYTYSRGWGPSDKDTLYRALREHNPGVIENLEGTSLAEKLKTSEGQIQDCRIKYMDTVIRKYQRFKEYTSRTGERVSLAKRYTELLLLENYRTIEEREREISFLGGRHLQLMKERSSDEYSPTTIQDLFEPDDDQFIPRIVVLQGPAGIGKTMTCQKIMLDWASGKLYQDRFDFVFYLSCRELTAITSKMSFAGLVSKICRLTCPDNVMRSVLQDSEKLLLIIDGLDELKSSLEEETETCEDPFLQSHPRVILRSLLSKQLLLDASLIITTRPFEFERLDELIEDSRHVEMLGFTGSAREKYVYNYFEDEGAAEKALRIIKENDVVFTMCAVPIVCWIVCTILRQEMKKNVDFFQYRTATSIYLLYVKGLINYHCKDQAVLACLKKLCSLANKGVFNKKVLFEEEDLERHGLSLSEVESVFLNENIFQQEIETSTYYSFIHRSVQEFLAALYYVLEEDPESEARRALTFPSRYFGDSISDMCVSRSHLSLMVQFLFGLSDINRVQELSKITGRDITFQATPEMKTWLTNERPSFYKTELICCLYEMQDEDFVRKVMSRTQDIEFLLLGSMKFTQQLVYCLKSRTDLQKVAITSWEMGGEFLQVLSPYLQQCSELRLSCSEVNLLGGSLCTIITTSKSLKQVVLSDFCLQECDVKPLCDALQHPDCTLQKLRFKCCLSQSTRDDISSLITSGCDITLEVKFCVGRGMPLPEACCLFETIKIPNNQWGTQILRKKLILDSAGKYILDLFYIEILRKRKNTEDKDKLSYRLPKAAGIGTNSVSYRAPINVMEIHQIYGTGSHSVQSFKDKGYL